MATPSISYGDFKGSNLPPLTIEYRRKRILIQGHDPHSSLIHWFSTTILWCLIHLHTQVHNPTSSKTVWKQCKIGYIKINLAELRYTSGSKQIYFVIKERKQICVQRKETNSSSLLFPTINRRNPTKKDSLSNFHMNKERYPLNF